MYKRQIADRLKDFLVKKGVNSAIINLGGNVLCIGSKPNGTPFKIGIDVYKRQLQPCTSVRNYSTGKQSLTKLITVSYTHLDVYKRQLIVDLNTLQTIYTLNLTDHVILNLSLIHI